MPKPKFKPSISRVKLNPEQAVLQCNCYSEGRKLKSVGPYGPYAYVFNVNPPPLDYFAGCNYQSITKNYYDTCRVDPPTYAGFFDILDSAASS